MKKVFKTFEKQYLFRKCPLCGLLDEAWKVVRIVCERESSPDRVVDV